MKTRCRLALALSLFLGFVWLVSLGLHRAWSAENSPPTVIHIGYQKFNTLNLLKARGTLEKRLAPSGVKVEWHQFAAGPQLFEALNAGSLDFGHAADAPSAFAQAAGVPFVLVAAEPPYSKGQALLVPKGSSVKTVADLRGKTVAVGKGWNVQYLLARALEEAGLKLADVKPVYFKSAADSCAAFESGTIDAIGLWDPFYAAVEASAGAPGVLRDGAGLTPNYTFLVAHRDFAAKRPELVRAILEELKPVDDWANANPDEVATLLAPQLGLDVTTLRLATGRREYGVRPVDAAIIADQQRLADTFLRLGEIPRAVRVPEAVVVDAPWWTAPLVAK